MDMMTKRQQAMLCAHAWERLGQMCHELTVKRRHSHGMDSEQTISDDGPLERELNHRLQQQDPKEKLSAVEY